MVEPAQWHIAINENPEVARLYLVALGADAILVHDQNSMERYHDMAHPYKFKGVLPVLYDRGEGDVIYQVPRKPGLARVLDAGAAQRFKMSPDPDLQSLQGYVNIVEGGAPAALDWRGTDWFRVRARLGAGQVILAQVSHDPAWRAYSGAQRLPIRKDAMNFMLIEAPPGDHDIRVVFELPLENAIGRVVTGASVLVLCGVPFWRRRAA
jgi:hypothetical protein